MLPKHFNTTKFQDPINRETSSTSYPSSTDRYHHFVPFAKMIDPTINSDKQIVTPERSEHAADTSDLQSFKSFMDEDENSDEHSYAKQAAGEYLSDDKELSAYHYIDHKAEEADQGPKVNDAKAETSDNSKGTSMNEVRDTWFPESDDEYADSDVLTRERNQYSTHSTKRQDFWVAGGNASENGGLRDMQTAVGLQKYRPSVDDLALLDQRCKNPPATGKGWSIPASWPPPPPTADMPAVRPDVVPPENSPLHIQIQAYALRWGTWVTTVKDDERREELLKWVTEKMRAAWETAIKEGYHPRPITSKLQAGCDSADESQTKQRGRKRVQSPSRQAAPFAHEGKDPCAITTGELNNAGITMEMINDRVANRDLDAGEMLLDEVLTNLNKDKIEINDWSRTKKPSVIGRNLLMYSLFIVQESRAEILKLERLFPTFRKDSQKKNTQTRIDMYQEREKQHLALATELHLNQAENEGAAPDVQTEIVDVDSEIDERYETSDSSAVESSGSDAQSDGEADRLPDDLLYELAVAVHSEPNEASLVNAFISRGLQSEDFEQTVTGQNSKDSLQKVKNLLGAICSQLAGVTDLRHLQTKTHSPSEKIKIGHDVRLATGKIQILQSQLRDVLGLKTENQSEAMKTNAQPAPVQTISPLEHKLQTKPNLSQQNPTPSMQHSIKSSSEIPAATSPKAPVSHSNMQAVTDGSIVNSLSQKAQNADMQKEDVSSSIIPAATKEDATNADKIAQDTVGEATAKQVFVDHFYRPWLNNLLRERQLPPVQGPLSGWQHIKDILIQLDFGAAERNVELRRFKEEFEKFFARIKQHFTAKVIAERNSMSPSTVPAVAAPQNLQKNFSQPQDIARPAHQQSIDAEILAAIPPKGVHAGVFVQHFLPRFGGNFAALSQTVRRVAVVGPGNIIYPRTQQQIPTSPTARPSINTSVHSQTSVQPSHSIQQQGFMPHAAPSRSPHLHSAATPSALPNKTSLMQSPHQIVTLKTNPGFDPSLVSLPSQSQSADPVADEYSPYEVNSTRGFSFRYLPGSKREQRERMDDAIEQYITTAIKSRKSNRFGQYVQLHDPLDPAGPPVLHGFWDVDSKGRKRSDIDWFYTGANMPADWPASRAASSDPSHSQNIDHDNEAQEQKKPKIRLNIGSNLMPNAQSANVANSGYSSIGANAYSRSQPQTAPKKGTKRPHGGENKEATKSKKKRRTAVDDDDDEYDPSQDH